jgi:transposase
MATQEASMSNKRYTDEFRAEPIKQVIEHGFTVVDVAARIGVPKHTLYSRVQVARIKGDVPSIGTDADNRDSAEVRRLNAELKRVTEKRDILKKSAAYFARG